MPLAYYRRLTRAQKAVYQRSDVVVALPLRDPGVLCPLLRELEAGLLADEHRPVQRSSHRLVAALVEQMGAPRVTVRVLAVRPSDEESELHGLYEVEEGRRPVIRAWMRTAVRQQPVAFRSFLRTLLHEVCHHHDFTVLGLEESFHTEGFFKREAHLARQLLRALDVPVARPAPAARAAEQLALALSEGPAIRPARRGPRRSAG